MSVMKSHIRRTKVLKKLNILVIGATHERYEQTLALTGHNFYSLNVGGKQWDSDYAKKPNNYYSIDYIPIEVDFDLILVHTSCERLKIALDLRQKFNIPVIRHTHILPDVRFDVYEQIKNFRSIKVDLNTFISEFNMQAWGYNNNNSAHIDHGLNTDFWCADLALERDNRVLSVVNLWAQRDWACGWNLWKSVVTTPTRQDWLIPIKVSGKNPGLSQAAKSVEDLRSIYNTNKIFLNTSLHSPVPMSLLEAMACGCAIVSTETCMIPEIIKHGYNGFLSNDPKELRKYCIDLLVDNDLAKTLGQNAKKTILEKYNLENFTNKWNKVLRGVADEGCH